MKKETAVAVLEEEIYALSRDLRLARFVLSQLWEGLIPEEEVTTVSRDALLVSDAFTRERLEILTDYLSFAAQKLCELDNQHADNMAGV